MTDKSATFKYVIYIRTTPEKIYDAITAPEIARRYWGHENVSDWRPGSKWEHVRANDERPVELVGEVVEADPPNKLVITWANASQAEDRDQYSRVTFEIEPDREDMVKLTVTHDELQPGSGMEKGISKGWPHVLSSLKSFLETGRGIDLLGKEEPTGKENKINGTYTGRCACGTVTYEARGRPVEEVHCQCRHCQMRSGTGHASYLVFAGSDAVKIDGDAKIWSVAGDSGNVKNHAFCPTCGTPIYLTFAAMPDVTAIHAGSLDDPRDFRPAVVTYKSSGYAWDVHDPTLIVFDKMPPA